MRPLLRFALRIINSALIFRVANLPCVRFVWPVGKRAKQHSDRQLNAITVLYCRRRTLRGAHTRGGPEAEKALGRRSEGERSKEKSGGHGMHYIICSTYIVCTQYVRIM